MTAREALMQKCPNLSDEKMALIVTMNCPSDYDYYVEHQMCGRQLGKGACSMCWDQEIIDTEKENENMSDDLIEKAYDEKYGSTSASAHIYDIPERTEKKIPVNDLDYKAEYEKLKELIQQKDVALLANMNQHAEDEARITRLTSLVEKYRFGLRVVEAFLGTDIVEDFE